MFKRLFQSSPDGDAATLTDDDARTAPSVPSPAPAEEMEEAHRSAVPAPVPLPAPSGTAASFEQIYRAAAVKPPRLACGVLNVAEMARSPHLAGMSQEVKRNAILMALEATGAVLEDVLQDAMIRQRALNEYEALQEKALKEFESSKSDENARIQAEMERVAAGFMARLQANRDEVAHRQDGFRAWQQRKQQESQRIADAAAYCARPSGNTGSDSLAALFQQVTNTRT